MINIRYSNLTIEQRTEWFFLGQKVNQTGDCILIISWPELERFAAETRIETTIQTKLM